ncbi:MAG: hypothetical protein NC078_08800, partial [Ruminococcus sp.]|nr:hypothetical protein [Ruminococcus sp.]
VRGKSYDEETDEIIYEVCINGLYSKADVTPLITGEDWMAVYCENGSSVSVYDELRISGDYIMPVFILHQEEEGKAVLLSQGGECIRRAADVNGNAFWEIDREIYSDFLQFLFLDCGFEEVYETNSDNKALIPDGIMREGMEQYFEATGKTYISEYADTAGLTAARCTLSDLFRSESETGGFEQVHYLEDENGNADLTTLVLENERHFVLAPDVNGEVVYAGDSLIGEKLILIKVHTVSLGEVTLMFAGNMELECEFDEDVAGQVIAECYSTPIYCRIIGSSGRAMEVEL